MSLRDGDFRSIAEAMVMITLCAGAMGFLLTGAFIGWLIWGWN